MRDYVGIPFLGRLSNQAMNSALKNRYFQAVLRKSALNNVSSHAITLTFRLIPMGKEWTPLYT